MSSTVVIGLGNPLMRDEGVGIRVIERIRGDARLPADVEVLDLGTGGLTILHAIEGRSTVIFVDCAMMDDEPGAIRRFTPDEVRTRKVALRLSVHEGDLLGTLELARKTGEAPGEVIIFGIQPKVVEPGEGLSSELEQGMDGYVETVVSECRRASGRRALHGM